MASRHVSILVDGDIDAEDVIIIEVDGDDGVEEDQEAYANMEVELENIHEEGEQHHEDPNNDTEQPQSARQQHHQPRINNEKRMQILIWLLDRRVLTDLPHGTIQKAALHFGYGRKAISNIWNTTKKQKQSGEDYNVNNKYTNCGRKRIHVTYEDIVQIPLGRRTCIRDIAASLDISPSTAWRLVKRRVLRAHSNPLHPGLTEENRKSRMKWVLDLIVPQSIPNNPTYFGMYNFIHIDEKWFYLTQKNQRCYLAKAEPNPNRSMKNKKWIPKVMFFGAVSRPWWDEDGNNIFDGKIGMFPLTEEVPAKRTSKNRSAGTLELKPIDSITQEVTRNVLIHKLIPAIKQKWPRNGDRVIYIQQDNAKPHIRQDDPIWQQVYQQDGFTFILVQQPPNSPDVNLLDLGHFNSIQSLMHKKMPENVQKLCEAVEKSFEELHAKTLSNTWMTLQYTMNEILKARGKNDYELPHVKKKVLEDNGELPNQVVAPKEDVEECLKILNGT